MRRVLALLASLLLASAAEPPTKRAFLMLGGATQILDADGKVTWKYPAETRDGCVLPNGHVLLTLAKSKTYPGGAVIEVTRDKQVVWTYVDDSKFGVHEFQLLDADGKPLAGALR